MLQVTSLVEVHVSESASACLQPDPIGEFVGAEEQQQFNCSGQTRDSWKTITKQKNTAVDHSGNNTVLRIKGM